MELFAIEKTSLIKIKAHEKLLATKKKFVESYSSVAPSTNTVVLLFITSTKPPLIS